MGKYNLFYNGLFYMFFRKKYCNDNLGFLQSLILGFFIIEYYNKIINNFTSDGFIDVCWGREDLGYFFYYLNNKN